MRSRTTGGWLISATRPLLDSTGALQGVLVAAIEPSCFERVWRSVDFGESGSISLLRRDGTLMIRSPRIDSQLGSKLTDLRIAAEPADKSRGDFEKPSAYDVRLRLFAYRRLSGDPDLVVVVGQSSDMVLEPWRRLCALAVGAWFIGFLMLMTVAWRLARTLNALMADNCPTTHPVTQAPRSGCSRSSGTLSAISLEWVSAISGMRNRYVLPGGGGASGAR